MAWGVEQLRVTHNWDSDVLAVEEGRVYECVAGNQAPF